MNFSEAIAALARIDAAQNALIRAQTATIEALTARIAAVEASPPSSAEDVAALLARIEALESAAPPAVAQEALDLIAAADPGAAPASPEGGEGGVTLPDINP